MKALIKVFNGTEITMRQSDDGRWGITAEQLGNALGYLNPRISIHSLIKKHREEIAEFLGVTETITPGGKQETTIILDQGIMLLAMLARTDVAKSFRRWVADLLLELKSGEKQVLDTGALAAILMELKELREQATQPQITDPKLMIAKSIADNLPSFATAVQKIVVTTALSLPPEKQAVWTAAQIRLDLLDLGISASWQKIGLVAKAHGIQCPKEEQENEYGFWSVTSVNNYSKVVNQFQYNKAGRDRLITIFTNEYHGASA